MKSVDWDIKQIKCLDQGHNTVTPAADIKLLTPNELSSEPRTCLSLLTVFSFLSSATLATGKLSAAVVGVAL